MLYPFAHDIFLLWELVPISQANYMVRGLFYLLERFCNARNSTRFGLGAPKERTTHAGRISVIFAYAGLLQMHTSVKLCFLFLG